MFGHLLSWYTMHLRGLLPHDGILPVAKFTLRPSLAFSYIGKICGMLQQQPYYGFTVLCPGLPYKHRTTLSLQLKHVSTIGKKLLNSNTSSTCPHNMVNFGLLTTEICWRGWAPQQILTVSHLGLGHRLRYYGNITRHATRNGITERSQRAPPIFVWAAIMLGIGPHSS